MQENKQKISPIKQRILQFVDTLGVSKRDFYANTGISRGTLESKTGITEETITKFFATYKNISPDWLLMGVGDMLKHSDIDSANSVDRNCKDDCKDDDDTALLPLLNQLLSKIDEKDRKIEEKEAIIADQAKNIGALQKEVEMLQKGFGATGMGFTASDDANVVERAGVRR